MTDKEETTNAVTETDDVTNNLPLAERLTDLKAKATAEYAVKHYKDAAELYSQATELQAELNGEMSVNNADLLYAYGKCLYFLAQQTSSVLGGDAAAAQLSSSRENKPVKKRKLNGTQTNGESSTLKLGTLPEDTEVAPALVDVAAEEALKPDTDHVQSDKPFFQISGDAEDWDDDEDEDEDNEAEAEEDDQDDLTDAYEMLDLARVLYLKKLDHSEQSHLEESDKGKYIASIDQTPDVKDIKSRVADIHDIQAEVSLEGEKYAAAAEDLQKCLALREELESPASSILAECHFKLSLALEFASQSQQRDETGNPVGDMQIDWKIRDQAISQQEKAIESCKLRVTKEAKEVDALEAGDKKDKMMAQIEDVQEMIAEMDQRLSDLRKPPISVKEETAMKEQLSGVLSSMQGASSEQQEEALAKMAAGAADISGLVKKKKPKKVDGNGGDSGFGSAASTPAAVSEPVKVIGKRKADHADHTEAGGKKAKVEDTEDSGL